VSAHCLQVIDTDRRKSLGSLTWQARPSQINQIDSSLVLRALTRQPAMLSEVKALDRQWPLGGIVTYDFQAEGLSLIHFGSAAWIKGEIDQLQPDIALIPVEHEPEAQAACVHLTMLLKPRLVIPHHWDDYYPPLSQTIDLRRFKSVMQTLTSNINVYIPTLGQSFDPAELL
jgi:L-ascorbate metabolism protein UlaG (beta-lactamase superfamily)